MIEYGTRAKRLPPPPQVTWGALIEPRHPKHWQWLELRAGEIEPVVIEAVAPTLVIWSSLWAERPDDRIRFDLSEVPAHRDTLVRYGLLADDPPDAETAERLRYRLSVLIFAELRASFG